MFVDYILKKIVYQTIILNKFDFTDLSSNLWTGPVSYLGQILKIAFRPAPALGQQYSLLTWASSISVLAQIHKTDQFQYWAVLQKYTRPALLCGRIYSERITTAVFVHILVQCTYFVWVCSVHFVQLCDCFSITGWCCVLADGLHSTSRGLSLWQH